MAKNLMLFTGNANPQLARDVARELGISLGQAAVKKSVSYTHLTLPTTD